jgi:hypothetical protein
MLWFGLNERYGGLSKTATLIKDTQLEYSRELDTLKTRIKLLEKRLGVTYAGGAKKRPHYKVAGKVGRPRKIKDHGEV